MIIFVNEKECEEKSVFKLVRKFSDMFDLDIEEFVVDITKDPEHTPRYNEYIMKKYCLS